MRSPPPSFSAVGSVVGLGKGSEGLDTDIRSPPGLGGSSQRAPLEVD